MYSGYDLKLFFACYIVMGTYLVLPNGDDSNLNARTQSWYVIVLTLWFRWYLYLCCSLSRSWMHLFRLPWTLLLILVLSMVSCGAIRCSWKRDTDFRGLSRHRSTCHHYQKASTLATQKRRDRARELVEALQKSTPQLTTSSTSTLSVSH
jgi:hypothetical protein